MDFLPHLSVNDCWVVGLERFAVGPAGEEEEFFEIRTEWAEKGITYLRRRYHDLVKLVKNLSKSFPDDRGLLPQSLMLEGMTFVTFKIGGHLTDWRLHCCMCLCFISTTEDKGSRRK